MNKDDYFQLIIFMIVLSILIGIGIYIHFKLFVHY